ncbi:MAG: ABC transporter permease, partial [Bacillota bacterium]
MFSYISRRILYSIPLLLIISFVAFTIITLPPGDYLSIFINQITSQTGISQAEAQEMAAQLEEMYGLDQPFFVQYYEWITGIIFQGDFGFSFNYRKPVSEVIWPRLGMTVVIALGSHL